MKENIKYSHYQIFFMSTFGTLVSGVFLNYYFIKIGFTEFHLGLFFSISSLASMITLPISFYVNSIINKRGFFLKYNGLAMLMLFLFIIMPYFSGNNSRFTIWGSLISMAVCMTLLSTGYLVLFPWLYSIVGKGRWGSFFSVRQIIGYIPIILFTLVFGQMLGKSDINMFTFIFLIALASGILSMLFMRFVPEYIPSGEVQEKKDSITGIVKLILHDDYFIIISKYSATLSFGIGLFAPIAYKYLITHVGISSLKISIFQIIMSITSIISFMYFGKLCDRKGNLFALKMVSTLLFTVPLILLFVHLSKYVLPVLLFALGLNEGYGFVFSGVFISLTGLLMEHIPEKNKTVYLSFIGFIKMLSMSAGSLISGVVAQNVLDLNVLGFSVNGFQIVYFLATLVMIITFVLALQIKYKLKKSEKISVEPIPIE